MCEEQDSGKEEDQQMASMWDEMRLKWGLLEVPNGAGGRSVMRPSTRLHRAKVTDSVAKACILTDPHAYKNPRSLVPFWDEPILPSRYDLRVIGGRKAAKDRAGQHDFSLGRTMAFNAEFILGLRVSGALGNRTNDRYRIYLHRHIAEALTNDLQLMDVPFKATPTSKGYTRISQCPFLLWQSCCQGKATPSILAGILAGARIVRVNCEAWLELPSNPLAKQYLEGFLIPTQVTADGKKIRLSPYFAALLSPYMPDHLAARFMTIAKPVACCPLMPSVYFDWLGRRPHFQTIPATAALPFACSYATHFHHGFQRESMTSRGRQELGIVNVGGELARISTDWIDTYFALRGDGEVTHERIRERLKQKYFPPAWAGQPAA